MLSKSQTLNCASHITINSYLQESGSTMLITSSFDLVKCSQEILQIFCYMTYLIKTICDA